MSDNIDNLGTRRDAKKREIEALRAYVESMLQCSGILADAVEQMWDFAERAEIVKTLRMAADKLEDNED